MMAAGGLLTGLKKHGNCAVLILQRKLRTLYMKSSSIFCHRDTNILLKDFLFELGTGPCVNFWVGLLYLTHMFYELIAFIIPALDVIFVDRY